MPMSCVPMKARSAAHYYCSPPAPMLARLIIIMSSSIVRPLVLLVALTVALPGQVYSPRVLKEGQPDAGDIQKFAKAICAGAKTPREKAEAIWRFFLTDGRFV